MRLIGHVANEAEARTFGNFLYVQGIENQIEQQVPEGWAIWIVEEDKIEQGTQLLAAFHQNPADPKYQAQARAAGEKRSQVEKEERNYRKKMRDRRQLFGSMRANGLGPVTVFLIAASVVVFCWSRFASNLEAVSGLFISEGLGQGFLPEVFRGQVWRLVTPIFIHMSVLHIFFNLWWCKDLGGALEARLGSWHLGGLILVTAVVSNVAQYYFQGPAFGGLSGVVYGLFGFIWLRGRYDPNFGIMLHPTTVLIMMIWFVLGFTQVLGAGIANIVHAVGLGIGCAWGYLSSLQRD